MSTKTETHYVPKNSSRKDHDSKSEDPNSTRNSKKPPEKYKPTRSLSKLKQSSVELKTSGKTGTSKLVKTNTQETASARKPLKAVHKSETGKISSPPSRRITKTKFFPSKNHYTELLHELNRYEESRDEVPKKSKTTSHKIEDAQILNKHEQSKEIEKKELELSESSCISDRPRTSTLRKGSIVNHNIAGPEVPKNIEKDPSELQPHLDENNFEEEIVEYQDDFDSYESDFENCSSSDSTIHDISDISTEKTLSSSSSSVNNQEESCVIDKVLEKKLDSGNFDLGETKLKHEFSNNQETINFNINSKTKTMENNYRSNLTSLSDEGFEESKSLQFLNFADARKRHDMRKCLEKRKKRGEELLNMIRLDQVNFLIFDLPAVSYETYIRHFGKLTSIQEGVQTDRDEVDDQTQTYDIETCSKWVQMPPHMSNPKYYKYEMKGVGPDLNELSAENLETLMPTFNERRLEIFITNAGELILDLLKEREPPSHRTKGSVENTLGNGFIRFDPPVEFLVHVDDVTEENSRSVVCLWNVNDEQPKLYMTCYGGITSSCFGPDPEFVLAGLQNGLLVVWDTRNSWKNRETYQFVEQNMRPPTFLTTIEMGHCCQIIALRVFLEYNTHDSLHFDKQGGHQFCSLDYEGDIIIWSLINKQHSNIGKERQAHMENILLCKTFKISLRTLLPEMKHLICTDIILPVMQSEYAFIGTNYGTIVQCFLSKQRTSIKQIISDDSSSVECLCACPFSQLYFLASFKNGNISLYSVKTCKPLMVISNEEYKKINAYCVEIQWSLEKPCMFYTRSSENTVDVWDLTKSNVLPIKSISFDVKLMDMEPSPSSLRLRRTENVYLMISTDTAIYMHFLPTDQMKGNSETYKAEMKTFINYGNRL
ncbi:hypothetical protein WA026_003775 [Henosepilachna vigintioctopunctata]|uniref:WD repeat-containing protein 60 n=1 Tax=Henosepilachna vigintioctopunctata TaxID=420089 RepID=A0AAW1UGQ5_9CUCU